tara:strand:- start:34396 stop:34740 length:345 start_codon:yes stop_codon:yes gene_type:complete
MTSMVRVSGLRGFSSVTSVLGGKPDQLARECGINPHTLDDEDALIPYRQLIYLMEHCTKKLNVPDFGLRLAATQVIGILGPPGCRHTELLYRRGGYSLCCRPPVRAEPHSPDGD